MTNSTNQSQWRERERNTDREMERRKARDGGGPWEAETLLEGVGEKKKSAKEKRVGEGRGGSSTDRKTLLTGPSLRV